MNFGPQDVRQLLAPVSRIVRLHFVTTIYQTITLLFAASVPIVALVVAGRHVVSVIRSLRKRRFKFALFSAMSIAGMLLLLAGVALIWFGYGVGHGRKDVWSDIFVLGLTAAPIYGVGYGLWRLACFMDERSSGVAD